MRRPADRKKIAIGRHCIRSGKKARVRGECVIASLGAIDIFNASRENKEAAVVEAPAFSLTKVLATAAAVVTPIVAVIIERASSVTFTATHIVALTIGILGFLAIASAADVIARAVATSAVSGAEARGLVRFDAAVAGRLEVSGKDPDVEVLGAAPGDVTYLLIRDEEQTLRWVPGDKVVIPPPPGR